jgi:hypothetical protein
MEGFILNQSIEELENSIWEDGDFPTGLVEKCFYARKKKLKDLDSNEIRLLLTQKISLKYTAPLAISFLGKNIFLDAGLYEGDLLLSVLNLPPLFWKDNTYLWEECLRLLDGKESYIKDFPDLPETIKENIINAYSGFKMIFSD